MLPKKPTIRTQTIIPRIDLSNHISVVLVIAALGLTWFMSRMAMHVDSRTVNHESAAALNSPLFGIILYMLLYMALALMAFRMTYGLYVGFHHIPVVAAYLTFGPIAAFIVSLLGRILVELGRAVFHQRLGIRPHGTTQSIFSVLFHAGAHSLAVLLSGMMYVLFGGDMPLANMQFSMVLPVTVMFISNVVIYQSFLIVRVYFSGIPVDHQKIIEALPSLLFGQVFSLPLSLLMSAAYFSLPIMAFVLLVIGTLMAGFVYRVSERSRAALERRVAELATLNAIGQSLTASLDPRELALSIYSQVQRVVETDVFFVALYSPDTQMVEFPVVMYKQTPATWYPRTETNGITEYIISTSRPLVLSGPLKEEVKVLNIDVVELEAESFLGVPLQAGELNIGVMAVAHQTRQNAYTEAEVAWLTTIASQAAIALRNATLYSSTMQMSEEMAMLNNLSSVVTATLDLKIVLDTTCQVIIHDGHADKTAVFLANEDDETIRLVHSIGLSEDYVAQFQNLRRDVDSGPTQVLNQRGLMAIPDVRTDPRALGWRTLAEVEGYVSLLTVPLIVSGQVIGFLAAFYSQPHLFGKVELDLMNTLANQVAVTVSNARLYQDTQNRAQELLRLVEASRLFTETLEPVSVAHQVLDNLDVALKPDVMALMLYKDDQTLTQLVVRGSDSLDMTMPEGSVAIALAERRPLLMPYKPEDRAILQRHGLRSIYLLPLVSQDKVHGITMLGFRTQRLPDERERQFAEALINQAATAMANAQLYRQTDAALADRVSELSAIEAISRQISGSLDLEMIIEDVLDAALQMTGASLAGFAITTSTEETMLRYVERYPQSTDPMKFDQMIPRHEGIIGRVLRTGTVELVGNLRHDPHHIPTTETIMCSALAVPIMHDNERVGAIYLESERFNAFTPTHERFVSNLADHAAIAIANAWLFEERQTQIDTLIKFRNLSLELLSLNSLKEVMNLIVEYGLIIAHAKDAHLYLYEHETETLMFGASLWLDGRENVEAAKPHRYGRTWRVAETGRAEYIEDVEQLDPRPNFRDGTGFRAIARIPLMRGEVVMGVLNIAFREKHHFTESEIRALDLLANQGAIAIENARLFDEQRISRDRMQAILKSTRDGVMLLGNGGELVLANPAAERLLNYSLHLATNRNLLRTVILQNKQAQETEGLSSLIKVVRLILAELAHSPDKIVSQEFQHSAPDGARYIEATVLPVRDNRGVNNGRLVVLRDISEDKATEQFREELTNMIVHDLRSPLSGVISSLRLLEDMVHSVVSSDDIADFDTVLNIAVASAENQMRMIESMLEIEKMGQGGMPLHVDVSTLYSVAEKATTVLEITANNAHVSLINNVSEDLPSVSIDEDQIRRVLVNLMDNAIRHVPTDGEVRVEAMMTGGDGKSYVQVGVLDNGKGIPPEFRERIFEKFVQVPKSALRGHRGIGLGLAFCKLAVETHGGKIWVDTSPSGGAAFWFTLPVAEIESVADSPANEEQA
jgi:two-component system, NtrC family, sensor histidine kinase KinB